MALLNCQFSSACLKMATSAVVILPEDRELTRVKTLYLLHGLTDNCTGWTRYTSLERYARERGIAVVMPEVQRSWYCDMRYGVDYFQYVAQELPQIVHRLFHLSLDREQSYIAGLSMGGFGALKVALTYPERYAGVGSFSGALDPAALLRHNDNILPDREIVGILGMDGQVGPENDLFALAANAKPLPEIYLSCGEQDALYELSNRFDARLTELGIPHRYDHRPGDHTWSFWDQSIQDCLAYLKLGKL